MSIRRLLVALVATVSAIWFAAVPVSATPAEPEPTLAGTPVVFTLPPLVADSPLAAAGDVGTQEWPVVSEKLCASANVFDLACIQAISQNGIRWTGIRGIYELGLSRPAGSCFGLNVALVSNRGTVPAAPGQTCFGRPLVREFLNLPLFGGYCGQVGFQDQGIGSVSFTPFLCFS